MEQGFFERVYAVVRCVPKGRVISYGEIAKILGCPRAARQVGWALHVNPEPGIIPCHRVVNRMGRLAPAFAFGGEKTQASLLRAEGVEVSEEYTVDLTKYLAEEIIVE